MPEIAAEISQCATTIREDVLELQRKVARLARWSQDDVTDALVVEMRGALIDALVKCNKLDTIIAAGRACGIVGRPALPETPQVPRELLLAGLHRAGDHTLDDEPQEMAGSQRALEVGRA